MSQLGENEVIQEGDLCARCRRGNYIEEDDNKFVCDECGHVFGERSIDVS